ncbi:MAG: DUF3810 domain-containing protein, partial [Planctomycetota bacterium]
GVLPVSVAEFLMAGLLLWPAISAGRGVAAMLRRRRRPLETILSGLLRLLTTSAVVVTLFYALWGVHYAREPLAGRLGWSDLGSPRAGENSAEELARLSLEVVEMTNELYREKQGGEARDPRLDHTQFDRSAINERLDAAYVRVAEVLQLDPVFGRRRGPVKALIISPLASALGITGFYFPWTAEANVNAQVPEWELIYAIAHEKAHQRGITGEDEAGFFGVLACILSDDATVRYSGFLFSQLQLLRRLGRHDRERRRELVALREPGVDRDVKQVREFWRRHHSPARRPAAAINNSFLKLNRVPGGIRSYRRSDLLLILYARSRGGSLRD